MITKIQVFTNTITFSGSLTEPDGTPNSGCLVVIREIPEMSILTNGKIVTDKFGNFSFTYNKDLLRPGLYRIEFYGTGKSIRIDGTAEDWEQIEIVKADLLKFENITFLETPTLTVSESTSDIQTNVNKDEVSTASFTINNLQTSKGSIHSITVYYKKATDSTYKILDTINFSSVFDINTPSVVTFKKDIVLYKKPLAQYNFYIVFINPAGVVADDGGVYLKIYSNPTTVEFNGINDLTEHVGVTNLIVKNTNIGQTMLLNPFIQLEWTDLKNLASTSFPMNLSDAFGNTVSISYAQAQSILSYVIYMYVGDNATPPNPTYPGNNANWFFMGEFEKANAEIRCPQTKWVSFWVGFKLKTTSSSTTKNNYIY